MCQIKKDDEVYVFRKKLFGKQNFKIDKNMFGKIINIDKQVQDDGWATQDYNYLNVTILLKNGRKIYIKDSIIQMIFGKYNFVKTDDLKELLNNYKKDKLYNEVNILSSKYN